MLNRRHHLKALASAAALCVGADADLTKAPPFH